MPHQERVRGNPPRVAHEILRIFGWLGALIVALLVQHFVVQRGVIQPAIAATGTVPPWAWGAFFAPEIVACFVAGWRLRSWALVAVYAALATLLRGSFHLLLSAFGEPGSGSPGASPGEFTLAAPMVALAYVVILAVASLSGRDEAQLDRA